MAKLTESIYLTLEPTRFSGFPKKAVAFRITGVRKNVPAAGAGGAVIKLNVSVEDSLFTDLIPVVDIELGDLTVIPEIEVSTE